MSAVELTMMNRSSAIVDILDAAGVRGTTRLASIENAKSLDFAQVCHAIRIWAKNGTISLF